MHCPIQVAFNKNGRWLVSAGQDSLIKLWDLRMSVKELMTLRGHRREVSSDSISCRQQLEAQKRYLMSSAA